jgi:PilZ domain-containing protein
MSIQPPRIGGCIENAQDVRSEGLTVRVWGLGTNGRAFSQNASLKNLTSTTAIIEGLQQDVAINEVIGLQFRDIKTRVQIVWLDNQNHKNRSAEVRIAGNQSCPWQSELSQMSDSNSPLNRRAFDRHLMTFPVEIKRDASHSPMRIAATDVSGNGCYLRTMSPSPAGSKLEITFWIDAEVVNCSALVRTCDIGFGMGIEFVGLAAPVKTRLQGWLDAHKRVAAAAPR